MRKPSIVPSIMRSSPCALSSLLSIILLLELSGAASSVTRSDTKPSLQGQGRIGIYDARAEQMRELNVEYAKVSESLRQLRGSYDSDHPKIIAVENHFKLLKSEIDAVRGKLEELGEQLSEDERSLLVERYQTNLEIEAGRRRVELAEVKIPAQRAGHWFGVYKTPGLSPQRGLSDSVVPTGSVIG